MSEGRFTGPVFIIGVPRSGTKLLRELLNQHPAIGIPLSETEFLPWMVKNWMRFEDISDRARFRGFYKEMEGLHYFQRMHEEGMLIAENTWYESCRTFTPAGVFEALIRNDVRIQVGENGIWGDKSPSYIGNIPLLKNLFPEARVVHIVRDVRDYCLSIHKAWGKSMLRAAQRWSDSVNLVEESRLLYPGNIIGVRYEDLLDNTEIELRRICAFMGVEYDASMCTLRHSVENLGDAKDIDKIKRDNKKKYVHGMNSSTRRRIEEICWPVLNVWGYEYDYSGPVKRVSSSAMTFLKLYDAINLFRFHISERGLRRGITVMLRLYTTSGNRGMD